MKLYIMVGSLFKFQSLFDNSAYLRNVLTHDDANVYWIETEDIDMLELFLEEAGIKYKIKED